MARPASEQPTDRELEILKILWREGTTRLCVICDHLREDRQIATTTVATLLKIMQEKGYVKRVTEHQNVLWQAELTQGTASNSMLRKLVDRVFEGSSHKVVMHILGSKDISEKEKQEIRRLLRSKQA